MLLFYPPTVGSSARRSTSTSSLSGGLSNVSPLDILLKLSRLPGFEATLEDLALLSDKEDSSSKASAL